MNNLEMFPPSLQSEISHIAKFLAPYTSRAYLVGGCVRDVFLNNKIKDLDIEVYDISPETFDTLMLKIGAFGVGKSFFVYKLGDIDLALARTEHKAGVGHKAYEVVLCDDEKIASKRRDFTMNAMMISIYDGKLLDFWSGQADLSAKRLALIDETSFKEDSLRVLRAVQFCARFGLHVEKRTLHVMRDIPLSDLSKTRIFWEFEKLFIADFLALGFTYLYQLELFEKLFSSTLSDEIFEKIKAELEHGVEYFEADLKPYYFVYIVANMIGAKPMQWLKMIEAPNHYINAMKNQPFFLELPTDRELAIIAIDLPIKYWLGNYRKGICQRAKKLDIYDDCYCRGISIQDVIADGFIKETIKIEYRRRVLEKIEKEFAR
jgi:tRNA nucleotidyltransferase (CCA-adding enzyme)